VNHIGGEQSAFGNDTNEVYVLTPGSATHHIHRMPKRQLADTLLDRIVSLPVKASSQKTLSSPTS